MSNATVTIPSDDDGMTEHFVYDAEDMSVSVEFHESDPDNIACVHCGDTIAEYPTDDGIRWLDTNNDAVCPSRDEDDDDTAHEPDNRSNPAAIANSAGVSVKGDSVTAWISVGDPRGAFTMTVWRGKNEDGTDSHLLSVPYAADPMPHATLTPITDHTYRIGGNRQGRRDEYATRQIDRLPSSDTYALQIESRDSVRESSGDHIVRHTHWVDITPEELSAIRAILSRRVES